MKLNGERKEMPQWKDLLARDTASSDPLSYWKHWDQMWRSTTTDNEQKKSLSLVVVVLKDDEEEEQPKMTKIDKKRGEGNDIILRHKFELLIDI